MTHDSLLVDIRRGTERPPFVMVHPVGGTVLFARHFAELLSGDPSFLGFEARGLDGRSEPHRSVEEMAECYVELLRARVPRGPYFLGGPSLGGMIAYEMAQRLLAAGEKVALLALFDTWGPGFPERLPVHRRAASYVDHVRGLESSGARSRFFVDELEKRLAPERYRARQHESDDHSESLEPGLARTLRRVTLALETAGRTYRYAPYPGRVVLFRAEATPREWLGRSFVDPTNGFGRVAAGGVEVRSVPGDHRYLFDEPNVRSVAAVFDDVFRKARVDGA